MVPKDKPDAAHGINCIHRLYSCGAMIRFWLKRPGRPVCSVEGNAATCKRRHRASCGVRMQAQCQTGTARMEADRQGDGASQIYSCTLELTPRT